MTDTKNMKPGERLAYLAQQLHDLGVPWEALEGVRRYAGAMEIHFKPTGQVSMTGPGGGTTSFHINPEDLWAPYDVGMKVLEAAGNAGCIEVTLENQGEWKEFVRRVHEAEKRGVFNPE